METLVRRPELLKKRDMRIDWTLPKATVVGHTRGQYTPLQGTACSAQLVRIGVGQESPLHSSTGEHIILQLDGEVEFVIEERRYELEAHDMLFIPADLPYLYRTLGDRASLFCSFIGRFEQWPPDATYLD